MAEPRLPDTIHSNHFHTAALGSGDDAFWAWREAVSPLFDVALPSPDDVDTFAAEVRSYHPGPILFASVAASAQHFRRAPGTIARNGINHYLVQLYRQGGYHGDANGRSVVVGPGDISVLDMSLPLQTRAQAFENISVIVPRQMLAPLLASPDAVHGTVLRAGTGAGALLRDHLTTLFENAADLRADEAEAIMQGTVSLMGACIGPTADAREMAMDDIRAATLVGIKRFIEGNLGDADLNAERVCGRFGVSRPTLYRLFEPYGGFMRYIQERRLRRCFTELTSPHAGSQRIADIAQRWGFGNEATFSRAFRRQFDVSPRELRHAAAKSGGRTGHVPGVSRWNTESLIESWLLSLGDS
ncbi:AraC family transcriptional regulator [Pigmentiphaga litoralis]|uniref:helix-turn-helix domain-containing protein n=1 Tax=Pigmentiphaga litoralis TaxID=516702 RepID=UPI00167BF08E|nr:helix-turn-helix domain-containing protein [Pigmentiphaga litoralis]GGX29263.1 AraC family transcriptional regulator [Pigmentiphaga litoralis]